MPYCGTVEGDSYVLEVSATIAVVIDCLVTRIAIVFHGNIKLNFSARGLDHRLGVSDQRCNMSTVLASIAFTNILRKIILQLCTRPQVRPKIREGYARCGHPSFHFIHQRETDKEEVQGQLGVELEASRRGAAE